ncbi:MAG TPA: phospholipase D-like domain-containing protein [Patescibacteria group bacterium]|nr:phospholipase D-like domain-containing protein [Patescibacteria group bacterium]
MKIAGVQQKPHSLLQRLWILLPLLAVCLLLSCAAVPDADRILAEKKPDAGPARIVGARGPLTAEQSKELLKDIGASDALRRHLAIEQAVAENPLVAGNATRILRDGEETFSAIFKAIKAARHHVNIEYYILENINHHGTELGELLIRKHREGVAVNMIYDSFGSSKTPPEFFDRLKKGGVRVVEYNPMNPLEAKKEYSLMERNHRKILVVDGNLAIVGGINLSKTYQSSAGKSGGGDDLENAYWRDTDIEVRGPVVAQVQKLFLDHWQSQKGPKIDTDGFFPKVPAQGDELARVLGSTPEKEVPRYYVTLISAIRNAQKNVWISNAYFVPTDDQIEDICAAARAGVDVRLLVPDKSDANIAIVMQRSHYKDLLKAGVRIYETHGIVLHSKTVTIDGVWSVVGSSNLDQRSVVFNDEVDMVVVGEDTAAQLEKIYLQDLAEAEEITLAKWKKRPVTRKFKDFFLPIWIKTIESSL